MNKLINPHTGGPMGGPPKPPPRGISNEELIQVLSAHAYKIDVLNQMHMQLAFWVEYVVEKIMSTVDADGKALVSFDLQEFQEFAKTRMTQLQQAAEDEKEAAQKAQATELLKDAQAIYNGDTEIDLDE